MHRNHLLSLGQVRSDVSSTKVTTEQSSKQKIKNTITEDAEEVEAEEESDSDEVADGSINELVDNDVDSDNPAELVETSGPEPLESSDTDTFDSLEVYDHVPDPDSAHSSDLDQNDRNDDPVDPRNVPGSDSEVEPHLPNW